MLHELLDLRNSLFEVKQVDGITRYQRKLEIIRNNVYGVDRDPFAINIARLRLWLSLAVEFDGNTPPTLPNLDFKIELGDALLSPKPTEISQHDFRQQAITDYFQAKSKYLTTHGPAKRKLREQVTHLREQIAMWTHGAVARTQFDWAVDFAEVFASLGFDVLLANPPYVRADAQFRHLDHNEDARQKAISEWKRYRESLAASGDYETTYEKWDLYIPFLERAYQFDQAEWTYGFHCT